MTDTIKLAEYEVEDSMFGTRTYQFEVGKQPKGAKKVGDIGLSTPPDGADPAPAVDSQEPANVLDESARGQATQADVDAAEKQAGKPANKAAAPADTK